MERAEWLLVMNVTTGDGAWFYHGNVASPVSGGFAPKRLLFNSLCHPRDVGRSELSKRASRA
jgi:hypothetical protein